MKITKEWLEEHNACIDQIVVFITEWPDGIALTKEGLVRAGELELDLDWLANELLELPVFTEYWRARVQVRAEYDHVEDQAFNKFFRVKPSKWTEYKRVKAQAWTKYCNMRAQAFMKAIEMEEL